MGTLQERCRGIPAVSTDQFVVSQNEGLPMKFSNCVWLSMIAFGLAVPQASADSWSGFQNGGKLSTETEAAPRLKWSPEKGIAWEAPLAGYGQSSPVVQGDVIYVTSTAGKMKDNVYVQGFDRRSGKELWKYEAKNRTPQKNTNYVSRAAPSPVCDEAGVIAFFEGGNLVALTPQGKVRWERNLVADFGPITARHGLGSSLEQSADRVFVWVERSEKPYLLAVAKKDGKTLWKTDGVGATSWSTPRLVPVADSHHLVLSGSGMLWGVDPADGKVLWTFDGISNNTTPTPVPLGEGRFLVGATVGRGESGGGNASASNGVIQIRQSANSEFQADFAWQAERATSSFGSPLAHRGRAYFVNGSGVVYCLDLKTGKELYAKRTSGSIWATPVGVGDRVYLFGKDGITTVVEAGSEFEELATNPLWKSDTPQSQFGGPVLYAAALVKSDLFLRRGNRLYKIAP